MTRQHSLSPSSRSASEPDYRMILGQDGRFIYASPDLMHLWDVDAQSLATKTLRDVIRFCEPDEALDDRVVIFQAAHEHDPASMRDPYICSVQAGEHKVKIGDETYHFQFDWIHITQTGQDCLIASSGSKGDTLKQMVRDMVNRSAGTSETVKTTPPAHQKQESQTTGLSERLREEDLRQFLTLGQEIFLVCDLNGTIQRYSPSFARLTGLEADHLLGVSLSDFILEADRPGFYSTFVNLNAEAQERRTMPVVTECRMIAGQQTNPDMMPVVQWHIRRRGHTLYCLGHELTQQRRLQTTLTRQKNQLNEAQAIARMGHWHWNVGEEAIEWSPQIFNIFGLDPKAFTPTLDAVNAYIHPKDVGRIYQAFQRALIGHNQYDMDFRIRRQDGEERIILCEGRCENDFEGDAIALYGIIRDVTEEKQNEIALRQAKEEAENAYAAKSRFLANMSHELRTPLNAIIGFSEMMEEQVMGPLNYDQYKSYISGIHESGLHLLDLITDILDMSRIEAGRYELNLETVSLNDVMDTALHMMGGRITEAGLSIDNQMASAQISIVADRRALLQIILNILSNAVKFTPEGGSITIQATPEDDHVTLIIEDEGVGIPDDKIRHVTKPFEQVSNAFSRGHQGSGLGLAITSELLEMHGGELRLDSVLDEGTRVTMIIPYQSVDKGS